MPGPYDFELPPWFTEDWDSGSFESTPVPGLMRVEIERGPKWDRKAVKGQTGETQTFQGWNNADVKIRVRTWTATQHADFIGAVLPVIEPEPGKDAPKQLAFAHSVANARHVDVILIGKVKGPTVDEDGRFSEWEIDAFQSIKKAPQQGNPGKPGQTPCQQCKAAYDQKVAEYNQALNDYNFILSQAASTTPEAITAAQNRMFAAQDAMTNQANICSENGCDKEESPAAGQQSGGSPPP